MELQMGRKARGIRGPGHLLAKGVPGRRLHGPRFLLVFGAVLAVRRVGRTEIPSASARGRGCDAWSRSRAGAGERAGGRRASESVGGKRTGGRGGWWWPSLMRPMCLAREMRQVGWQVAWSTHRPGCARPCSSSAALPGPRNGLGPARTPARSLFHTDTGGLSISKAWHLISLPGHGSHERGCERNSLYSSSSQHF